MHFPTYSSSSIIKTLAHLEPDLKIIESKTTDPTQPRTYQLIARQEDTLNSTELTEIALRVQEEVDKHIDSEASIAEVETAAQQLQLLARDGSAAVTRIAHDALATASLGDTPSIDLSLNETIDGLSHKLMSHCEHMREQRALYADRLEMVLLLDPEGRGTARGTFLPELRDAMRCGIPALIQSSAFANLIKGRPEQPLPENLLILQDPESQFVLCLSKDYPMRVGGSSPLENKQDIAFLGLNSDHLEELSPNDFEAFQEAYYLQPMDDETRLVDGINRVFDRNAPVGKRIQLQGHGLPTRDPDNPLDTGQIAGVSMLGYRALLQNLNDCHCEWVAVNSCYSGGEHFSEPYNETPTLNNPEGEDHNALNLHFPISVMALSDSSLSAFGRIATVTGTTPRISSIDFFNGLDEFLRGPMLLSEAKFLRHMNPGADGAAPEIGSSVRFPDLGCFRLADLRNDIGQLTWIQLQGLRKDRQEVILPKGRDALMVYPRIVDVPTTLEGDSDRAPYIVPMIGGQCTTFFQEVEVLFHTLEAVADSWCRGPFDSIITPSADKYFAVGELTVRNSDGSRRKLECVIGSIGQRERRFLFRDPTDGNYYAAPVDYSADCLFEKVDAIEYLLEYQKAVYLNQPSHSALCEAAAESDNAVFHETLGAAFFNDPSGPTEEAAWEALEKVRTNQITEDTPLELLRNGWVKVLSYLAGQISPDTMEALVGAGCPLDEPCIHHPADPLMMTTAAIDTPLAAAVQRKDAELVKRLLLLGADPSARCPCPPVFEVLNYPGSPYPGSPLAYAVLAEDLSMIRLLKAAGATLGDGVVDRLQAANCSIECIEAAAADPTA